MLSRYPIGRGFRPASRLHGQSSRRHKRSVCGLDGSGGSGLEGWHRATYKESSGLGTDELIELPGGMCPAPGPERAVIPVENLHGALLLISGKDGLRTSRKLARASREAA